MNHGKEKIQPFFSCKGKMWKILNSYKYLGVLVESELGICLKYSLAANY